MHIKILVHLVERASSGGTPSSSRWRSGASAPRSTTCCGAAPTLAALWGGGAGTKLLDWRKARCFALLVLFSPQSFAGIFVPMKGVNTNMRISKWIIDPCPRNWLFESTILNVSRPAYR